MNPLINPKISIIGAGNLGCTLARFFDSKQNSPLSLVSSSMVRLEKIAYETKSVTFGTTIDTVHRESRIIFITVPDREISAIVRKLAQLLFFDWAGVLVVHCSGAYSTEILSPLKKLGAQTASIHPIQTFPSRNEPISRFENIHWGVEAEEPALTAATNLVHYLGGISVHIPITAKPIYHVASVIASNYLVTLMNLAAESLSSSGLSRDQTYKILSPLVHGTLENLSKQSLDKSLTGPIARGDIETIEKHIHELRYQLPHLIPFYCTMAMETVRVAIRKGSLDAQTAGKLNRILAKALTDAYITE